MGKIRREGVLAECEQEAYQGAQDHDDGTGNTCGAKNLPGKGDDERLIDGSDPLGYQSDSSGYGLSEKSIEAEQVDSAPTALLKRVLGPHYYTLRVRLGLPDSSDRPTPATGRTVTKCVVLLFVLTFLLWSIVIYGLDRETGGARWALVPLVVVIVFKMVALLVIILRQPESPKRLPYMAPCVPFVPLAAMLVNIYLMLKLSSITWVRFAVWCFLGMQLSYALKKIYIYIFQAGITFALNCFAAFETYPQFTTFKVKSHPARNYCFECLQYAKCFFFFQFSRFKCFWKFSVNIELRCSLAGLLIYFGYGMWKSSLELFAQEEQAHASTYQRYDAGVDDSFTVEDEPQPQRDADEGPYQGWGGEDKGDQDQSQYQEEHQYQQQHQYQYQQQPAADSHRTTGKTKSRGRTRKGFEELVDDDDDDEEYLPE